MLHVWGCGWKGSSDRHNAWHLSVLGAADKAVHKLISSLHSGKSCTVSSFYSVKGYGICPHRQLGEGSDLVVWASQWQVALASQTSTSTSVSKSCPQCPCAVVSQRTPQFDTLRSRDVRLSSRCLHSVISHSRLVLSSQDGSGWLQYRVIESGRAHWCHKTGKEL